MARWRSSTSNSSGMNTCLVHSITPVASLNLFGAHRNGSSVPLDPASAVWSSFYVWDQPQNSLQRELRVVPPCLIQEAVMKWTMARAAAAAVDLVRF